MERQQRLMSAPPIISAAAVELGLLSTSLMDAVEKTARLLEKDGRSGSWDVFWHSVRDRQMVEPGGCGVCLAHGRSDQVKHLALAAARLSSPVVGQNGQVHLVFVFAIPSAMAEEYLRAVGALARTCGDRAKLEQLLAATSAEEFAGLLDTWVG
jgi:mannitol/fructose-specific phosphotransferase system IIA component (Ntr-type)